VDAAPQNPYLYETMRRHFFAFLALLSGLLAFGSPAQASLSEALACDSSIAASASVDAVRSEPCHCESPPATIRARRAGEPVAPAAVTPAFVRLPVLMGIERAYE
jgi:hypothetical protein